MNLKAKKIAHKIMKWMKFDDLRKLLSIFPSIIFAQSSRIESAAAAIVILLFPFSYLHSRLSEKREKSQRKFDGNVRE